MTTDDPEFAKEAVTPLATLAAPWSREISFSAVEHESGLRILRMRIKEGRARFTIVDLDEATVAQMMAVMGEWSPE
ncbi:hypothetical protein H261_12654 [Paramagnetospirillum caucaseum]|uniref:Uncharacterized protein n=1 Tax=Paramagnetospirillum caucaseum TaxID=1244869 RepID=M2ZQK6_9PROT|nr:hypothetical protein [Paramagnetospirillum caucaseum]EME69587.1 hypothetical protein H261_12654 [Paramagnetospirillum caucaseum]